MSLAIDARGVQKSFGDHVALRGIDLQVPAGTIFGLVGPNGAGKSTMLRILLDLLRPTVGRVTVLGEVPRGNAQLRARIGYLPGEFRVATRTSSERYLRALPGADLGHAHELAERLGLDLKRPVRALSKGNKQKLGLIQAFMHRPDLLILDEPTSGLDPLMQREFLALIREARDRGQTVLLSSHILTEIQHAADQVAVLAAGEIIATDAVSALRHAGTQRLNALLADAAAADVTSALTAAGAVDVTAESADGALRVRAAVRGDIDPAIKALARFHVVSLTVDEPDLEDIIVGLYEGTQS